MPVGRYVPENVGRLEKLNFLRIGGQVRSYGTISGTVSGPVTTGRFIRLPRIPLACKALTSIYISDQPGLYAADTFSQLVRMPQLRYVSLERDEIKALPVIDWQGIYWRSLSLAGNKLTNLPNELVHAPDMQMLDCKDNQLPAAQNHSFHNHSQIQQGILAVGTH